MSKETKERALICMRVGDIAEPHAPSYLDQCEKCKHQVWHAYSSPAVDHVFCTHCVPPNPVLERPTDEQVKEIRDYFRKHGL